MSSPRSHYLTAAGFETHVTEWGDPALPPLIMWHGLARTGRDFDEAASALSGTYFVVCPDTLGRGLSAWAEDAESGYSFPTYGQMALDMIAHYGFGKLRWVGTSMGGLLGMSLAATALKDRMTHLVINDVGPDLPAEGARRIAEYVGNPPAFATLAELEAWLRKNYAPFGQNTDAFWRRMTDTSARRRDDGQWTVHYDPRIVGMVDEDAPDVDIWELYDQIGTKTLVTRGAHSDVLPHQTAEMMTRRGPKPRLEVIPDCGHAPTLADDYQIGLLRDFLAAE